MTFRTKFLLVCFDLRPPPPNNSITACGATSFPGYHSFSKWAIVATSFPGSSLYLEKVPWLRLVTCLLDFSRFKRCDWRERLESWSLSPLSTTTEPSYGSANQTHSWLEFDAFNAALKGYLGIWLFPSTVGRSSEFIGVKNFGKELMEMTTTTKNGPRGEFHFINFTRRNRNVLIRLKLNTSYVRIQR